MSLQQPRLKVLYPFQILTFPFHISTLSGWSWAVPNLSFENVLSYLSSFFHFLFFHLTFSLPSLKLPELGLLPFVSKRPSSGLLLLSSLDSGMSPQAFQPASSPTGHLCFSPTIIRQSLGFNISNHMSHPFLPLGLALLGDTILLVNAPTVS